MDVGFIQMLGNGLALVAAGAYAGDANGTMQLVPEDPIAYSFATAIAVSSTLKHWMKSFFIHVQSGASCYSYQHRSLRPQCW